ncbi:MAG: RNA-binding protein [Deltaproteobacteria bacterium]|nr:RNA-binding protein [Deltaproteobacteria bacterium]
MNIYVGNLPYNVTEDELKDLFAQFGTIETVNIPKDNYSGQAKGFGFVEIPDNSSADKAIKALNGSDFKGRNIKVNQAKPREERSPRPRRY